jgi:hypothetical protein
VQLNPERGTVVLRGEGQKPLMLRCVTAMLQKLSEFSAESGEAAHRFADDSSRIALSFNERSRQILVRLAIDTPELSGQRRKGSVPAPYLIFLCLPS